MSSGEGPSEEQRAASWFRVRFRGDGGGKRVVTEVTGGDPGYGETSKMLAESALCLAFDALPKTSGQVTSAVAMGDALMQRLQHRKRSRTSRRRKSLSSSVSNRTFLPVRNPFHA